MQLPTQEQFVKDCLAKYRWESLPADQKWEEAHFPLPQCSGEGDTVKLWSADHTVQGLLQSVEFDHKCFHHKADKTDTFNLTAYYPQYLELFAQLKSQFASRQGKKGGKKLAELKLGVHAPGVRSAAGKKGGAIGGPKSGAITSAQKWQCLITGHISAPGGLARYQKARGIDTSLRKRVY